MTKKLKVSELTRESFKEFGQILSNEGISPDGGDENFGWYEKLGAFEGIDTISLNILECKKRDMKIDKLEYHVETSEAIIPMGAEEIVVVTAPAGDFDESKIKAFLLDGTKGIMFNKGVRHFIPYPVYKDVNCVVVFKHATGANDLIFDQLSETYEIELS